MIYLIFKLSLRQTFLRILDQTNIVFSELSSRDAHWLEHIDLPYAGDALAAHMDSTESTAILIVDAFRFELGQRLAILINESETSPKAFVTACKSPVPTMTMIGMPFALPGAPQTLTVSCSPEGKWCVTPKTAIVI